MINDPTVFDLANFNDPSTFPGKVCSNCGRLTIVGDLLGNAVVPAEDLSLISCPACNAYFDVLKA